MTDLITDEMQIGDAVRVAAYTGGLSRKKGLRWTLFSGFQMAIALGTLVKKHQLVDRENDRYQETVTDPKTGEVLHDVDEPLSKHHGHGSAKRESPADD